MKRLMGMILLATCLSALADEIRVKKMTQDGELERSFILQTNLPEKVVIDCQSFIQGLRIGEFESALTFLLDPEECYALQKRVHQSMRKKRQHCIDVDQEITADYSCH